MSEGIFLEDALMLLFWVLFFFCDRFGSVLYLSDCTMFFYSPYSFRTRFAEFISWYGDWLQNEVELMRKIWHPNLVSLLGFCAHENTWFLVYGLMQNGSLEDQLHGIFLLTIEQVQYFLSFEAWPFYLFKKAWKYHSSWIN